MAEFARKIKDTARDCRKHFIKHFSAITGRNFGNL